MYDIVKNNLQRSREAKFNAIFAQKGTKIKNAKVSWTKQDDAWKIDKELLLAYVKFDLDHSFVLVGEYKRDSQ